ncbi:GntR family transcriptional regulator, LSA1692 subfamily [Companilactobacillus sp. HBUAS56257]|uniref:GntR family transcriptional regulator, LSA1692 subfamily n=1 Tax=Companilactobacillus sp. HBUAS56257 TaxID=3109360 RepID=UPI002FEE8CC5
MPEYLYSKIADKLEKIIKDGEYGVHQKLPSETELSFRFDTSRLTIRKSIEELVRRKIVVKDRNRGTFVLSPQTKISSGADGLVGFTEAAQNHHLKSRTIVLDFKSTKRVPVMVTEKLHVKNDEPFWMIERLRLIDDVPMTHELLFLRKRFVRDLSIEDAKGSLFKVIEQTIPISYADQELESVLLKGRIAQLMEVKEGLPAFLAHTVSYSANGYPLLFDESYYPADKYTFHNILYRNH